MQTVYIETEWDPQDPIGETRFIEGLAARYGVPNAIVVQAWLDHPDAIAVLTEQASFKCVRSVRHKPGGPTSTAQVGHLRSLMSDEHWRRSYAALARVGAAFRFAHALVEPLRSRTAGPGLPWHHADSQPRRVA